jgi:nucleotide-binding universal stress UspA family protein
MADVSGTGSELATEGVIVVGLDGTDASVSALRWAIEEASLRGAVVRAINTWSVPVMASPVGVLPVSADHDQFESVARAALESWVREGLASVPHHDVPVEAWVVEGSPATALLRAARDADLLVVGGKRRGTISGMLLGSVSQQVTHHAVGPVVVVPAEPERLAWEGRPVVVGVDGSDGAAVALDFAVDEAARRAVPLRVVHGWEVPFAVPPEGVALVPRDDDAFETDSRWLLDEVVGSALDRAAHQPPSIEKVPVRAPGATSLLEHGEDAGLVVVGSRGRGGFAGLLLGSVSQQVLHRAPGPVAVIPREPETG